MYPRYESVETVVPTDVLGLKMQIELANLQIKLALGRRVV